MICDRPDRSNYTEFKKDVRKSLNPLKSLNFNTLIKNLVKINLPTLD
jgi:hypothetical protein